MIELKPCCKIPYPERLYEQYQIHEGVVYANVNASKILDMMRDFTMSHEEPLFFVLELPCKEEDEITQSKVLYNANDDYDVYFIDGLNAKQACHILDCLGDFLVKDGMNTFGIGGHESHEEILFGKYNVTTLFSENTEKYRDFFEKHGIVPTDELVSAWDTFDEQHPGECRLYVSPKTGKTIYDIPKEYESCGMYRYESRKPSEKGLETPITLDELIGKSLLVGITYSFPDSKDAEQKQFFGTVTEASETQILLACKDGSELSLPSDLRALQRAKRGEYTLRSTGEIVINPDFLAAWNVIS